MPISREHTDYQYASQLFVYPGTLDRRPDYDARAWERAHKRTY